MDHPTTFARIAGDSVDRFAPELSALDEAIRGKSRDPARCPPEYWRWCYTDGPGGGSGSAVALQGDRVTGKAGNVYLHVSVDGRSALATLSEGMAVRPESRSWHVYRGLIETGWRACASDGVRFGFAFVTPTAAESNRMLGWPVVGPVPVWMGVLDLGRALRARQLPGARMAPLVQRWMGLRSPAQPAQMEPVARFDAGYDELWANLAKSRPVCVIKDARYLQWRYRACPGRSYECWHVPGTQGPRGLLVFRVGERSREAYLLDVLARDDDVDCLRGMVAWLLARLRGLGVGLVRASCPAHSAEALVLRQAGLRRWPGFPVPMSLVLASDPQTEPSASRIAGWSFSMGDWLYH